MVDEEISSKKRKRAKRPGAKRSSKQKREKRANKRSAELEGTSAAAEQEAAGTGKKRKKADADTEDDLRNRVHVGGLPPSADEQMLLDHFTECGKIQSIKLLKNTRQVFRGSAFISFKSKKGAAAALELDGSTCERSAIRVRAAAPPVKLPDLKVYVGHVPTDADEPTLRKDFGECGEITKFRMLKEKSSGKFSGILFVTYADESGVQAALKYDCTEYGGRNIVVRLADKKGGARGSDEIAGDDASEGKSTGEEKGNDQSRDARKKKKRSSGGDDASEGKSTGEEKGKDQSRDARKKKKRGSGNTSEP